MDSIKCNKGARAHQDQSKSSKSKLYKEKLDEDRWGVVVKTQSVYLTKGTSPSLNFRNSACSFKIYSHSSCAFLVMESFFATGLDFISRRQYLNKSRYFKIFYSVESFWDTKFNKYPKKITIKKVKKLVSHMWLDKKDTPECTQTNFTPMYNRRIGRS